MLLPASMRGKISVSAGIRVSPTRPVHLSWIDPDQGETQRGLIGQEVQFLDLRQSIRVSDLTPREWFGLLRRWWNERRWDELCLLTNSIQARVAAGDLVRVATICQAIDDAAVADV